MIISRHAAKRAEEREISLHQIVQTVQEPEGLTEVRYGRKAAFKKFGDMYVVVIYEEQKDEIVVVTTLKVDRERLKRYGFSGV